MDKIIKEKKGYSYVGKVYRSKEEIYFSWYLDDMGKYTEFAIYEPHSLEVLPKKTVNRFTKNSKLKQCSLLQNFSYTPDFVVRWNTEEAYCEKEAKLKYLWSQTSDRNFNPKKDLYYNIIDNGDIEYLSYIDVKGGYSSYNPAIFSLKQKIIYDKLNIYVQKIEPKEFFKAINYYPERYLWTDSGRQKRKL